MSTNVNNTGVCQRCGRHRYSLNDNWLCSKCESKKESIKSSYDKAVQQNGKSLEKLED